MSIADGSKVTVRCVVRDAQGSLLDSGRTEHTFTMGRGEVISGLESILRDCAPGYRGCHRIAARDAYGVHRPELVFEAVRENLPPDLDLVPGAELATGGSGGRFQLRVVALTERGALLDGNHPLAGRDLDFEVEVLALA